MQKSGWRFLLAALGLMLIAAAPPAVANSPSGQAGAEATATPSVVDDARALNRPCSAGDDERASILCAQWKEADATYAEAVWNGRSFWLGVVGVVIGSLTFTAAGAAATYARQAAFETRRSADIANSALRPWVSASPLPMTKFRPGPTAAGISGYYLDVAIVAKDHGPYPAERVRFFSEIRAGVGNEADVLDELESVWDNYSNEGIWIFPGDTSNFSQTVFVSDEEIQAERRRRQADDGRQADDVCILFHIYCTIRYRTQIMSDERRTSFTMTVCRQSNNGVVTGLDVEKPQWWLADVAQLPGRTYAH